MFCLGVKSFCFLEGGLYEVFGAGTVGGAAVVRLGASIVAGVAAVAVVEPVEGASDIVEC